MVTPKELRKLVAKHLEKADFFNKLINDISEKMIQIAKQGGVELILDISDDKIWEYKDALIKNLRSWGYNVSSQYEYLIINWNENKDCNNLNS
jgi:hypothetical protein